MHIEINAGGLSAGLGVSEFQLNMAGFISDAEGVISCFKTVQNEALSLSGGVGNLQSAVDEISERIRQEEDKLDSAVAVQNKANDFLDLAIRVDKQVASQVNRNKDQFYQKYPHLEPVSSTDEENWGEKAWAWICGAGEYLGEKLEEGWNWVKDTAKKAWDGLVEFYNEHKKIIDTVLIVVGAIAAIAAVVASGGAALVPLLGALGMSTGAAMVVSAAVAVVAVVSTVGASTLNIIDTWAEIDNPTFNSWQKGLNITSGVTNFLYSVGNIYNSLKGVSPQEYIAQNASKPQTAPPKPQFTDDLSMTDAEYNCITKYNADSGAFNDPVRAGTSTQDTKQLSKMIGERQLETNKTLYRRATLKDLDGLDLSDIDSLNNKTYQFKGFMSATEDVKLPNYSSTGNVFFEFSAPKGVNALDLSKLYFNEVIFDNPLCKINLIEKLPNGYKIFASIIR